MRRAPHRTAPHRTAPHRTAPHRTAPHRTAPHRTGQVCDPGYPLNRFGPARQPHIVVRK
ncbi:hypothetical protein [Streptomyces sp. NPDC002265]|uniref:hypothetical protein n=1 Tax=Streptomyces sp. NPDC002265 TaxID=3154415 RepID=UPI00332DE3FC